MKIRLQALTLQCRKSREVINFARQVSFFHGGIGAGKSSIARLIDYCLGGDIERTSAIKKEFVSVELAAQIESHEVLFERGAQDASHVRVTWTSADGEQASVLAPFKANPSPIWGGNIFNFSDLVFHLFGVTPIKVRKSKSEEGSPMIRLSFRDMIWYCYLEQAHLDSSFYRLQEPIVMAKSRDVMRFVAGYYTERLQDLELQLDRVTSGRAAKIATSEQIRTFLKQFGYGSEADIRAALDTVNQEFTNAKLEQEKTREAYSENTHFVDQLRQQLREMSERLDQEEQAYADQRQRVSEFQALKAELVTARFKLARMEAATAVLSGVVFERCPACGIKVEPPDSKPLSACHLCHKLPEPAEADDSPQQEAIRRDLNARMDELAESIERAKKAERRQLSRVDQLKKDKLELDARLVAGLRNYDSAFVAQSRDADRKVATLEERVKNLERLQKLPEAIEQLLREADQFKADEERIRREMQEERANLTDAHTVIRDIEAAFLNSLLAIGMPGVRPDDQVAIDRKTWIPAILEAGSEDQTWDFYSTGSGGKKTLFNVCYALALHKVAAERYRPLPTILIIDTPMKNIGEEVNRDVFVAFYRHLYALVRKSLKDTQIIIIDKEYIAPDPADIDLVERYMTPDKDEHPPLISYYRGP
jgi:DNA repair exonuclease SbcCD ATPase subunit